MERIIDLILLSAPRISSSLVSVVFISLLAHLLSDANFGLIQINFSIAGIALWMGDLGSINVMVVEHSKRNLLTVRDLWYNRLLRVSAVALFLGAIGQIIGLKHFNFPLYVACLLDLNSDSLIGLRQLIFKQRIALVLQTGKKIIQLIGLIIVYMSHINLSSQLVSMIIGIPAIIAILLDFSVIGKSTNPPNLSVTMDSIKIWIQSGGTLLAAIDLWIIGSYKEFGWILYITFARRISNSLGIFGAATSVETLYDVGKNGLLSKTLRPRIATGFGFTFLVSILISLAMPFGLASLTGRSSSTASILIVSAIVCSSSLGVITASLNSVLLGTGHFRYMAISTYLSTFIYLSWLSLMPHVIGIVWTIGLGTTINWGLELIMLVYFLKKIGGSRILNHDPS